jgi:hypothetical protein
LFPAHKSLSFLMRQKRVMTKASWESEYQQNPIVVGGGVIPIEKAHGRPRVRQEPGPTLSQVH